ncbi:MAG: hypothetical protein ACK4EX_07810 [Thermaurantimonas sp.]|uniref:hypothetical protein n=1 Tax=Thermaurantimonas sp. TaxID=2681568 RepID=UPI00391B4789
MYLKYRQAFNEKFSEASYQKFLQKLNKEFDYSIPFRVAESPVFFSKKEKEIFLTAAEEILHQVLSLDLNKIAEGIIPENKIVPGNEKRPHFIAIDFGITLSQEGEIIPKLIELQGFPSLFYYQPWLYHHYLEHYDLPLHLTPFFCKAGEVEYYDTLKQIILGDSAPENVILLEIEPEKQNTAIDFIVTKKVLGIEYICLSKILVKGNKLYYEKNGKEIEIKRIYNRIIFDELDQRKDLKYSLDFTKEYDVEWITHPNWFFKISKLLLPHIDSKFSPKCIKLSEVKEIPSNLEAFVLKPLFSFSGSGVIFNVTPEDIVSIPDHQKDNYVLQEKVTYAEIIADPSDVQKSKAEFRILYVWPDEEEKPKPMINLMRLSKGEMIGVKYNKNKTWVGGSIGLFEQ